MLGTFRFTDRARPIVQIGVGDSRIATGTSLWGRFRWGQGRWGGNEPTWYDRTCDVHSVDIIGGRSRTTDRFEVGTCALVVDNSSGWADQVPDPDTVLALRPGRALRVGIDHVVHGRVWLFWGVVDSLEPTYQAQVPAAARIMCVDMLGDANRAKLSSAEIAPAEPAGRRVYKVLSRVPVPASRVRIDDTSIIVRSGQMNGQVADLVHQAAESAGGVVFGAPDGLIYFRARDWQTYPPTVPPDATIGNYGSMTEGWGEGPIPLIEGPAGLYALGGGATIDEDPNGSGLYLINESTPVESPPGSGLYEPGMIAMDVEGEPADVCPVSFDRSFARADIATRVIAGRAPITGDPTVTYPMVFDDGDAQVRYGVEPFERTNLITESDGDLASVGRRWLVNRGERTAPRIKAVKFDAATADNVVDLCTTISPFTPSRYRCRLRLNRGVVFDRQHYVTRTRHLITRDNWLVDASLDIADTYAASGGRWSRGRWSRATWGAST